MSYAIVFSSKTGNTELLADTLHSCLPQADCCYFGNPNSAAMEADTFYVGFWTDEGLSLIHISQRTERRFPACGSGKNVQH